MRSAPAGVTLAVVYLGIFPTVVDYATAAYATAAYATAAYATAAYVFSRLPASRAVTLEHLFTPVAILIAYLWLGEAPTVIFVVGGAVALCGVALVSRRRD